MDFRRRAAGALSTPRAIEGCRAARGDRLRVSARIVARHLGLEAPRRRFREGRFRPLGHLLEVTALGQRADPREIPRDVLLVGLDGAAADLEQLGVAPQSLDLVLADVAVAAEHLDRAVGDLLAHRRAEELDAVRVDAVP